VEEDVWDALDFEFELELELELELESETEENPVYVGTAELPKKLYPLT
jgi:hypothetical protein